MGFCNLPLTCKPIKENFIQPDSSQLLGLTVYKWWLLLLSSDKMTHLKPIEQEDLNGFINPLLVTRSAGFRHNHSTQAAKDSRQNPAERSAYPELFAPQLPENITYVYAKP